eukprot:TRINITY_DN5819_c0_g1_i1.p1 TRINITY_DN5819_c0_g1~~TRINITY_DN5819_c0_g1_i1.p1  ORF type:complete len:351 (+),score=87.57 TRINITY_DN5819_c0_g1_i1:266-1318(+)
MLVTRLSRRRLQLKKRDNANGSVRHSQFVYKAGEKFKKQQKKISIRQRKSEIAADRFKEQREERDNFTVDNLRSLMAAPNPPASLTVPVYNLATGETTGEYELPPEIFSVPVRIDVLHERITWLRAKWRKGNASGLSRGEVRGSTRKLYKQKGTGRARAGSIRSPIRLKGGIAHPPKPKDWSKKENKKTRKLGMKSALSAKFAHNQIIVVDDMDFKAEMRTELTGESPTEIDETLTNYRLTKGLKETLEKNGFLSATTLLVDNIKNNRKLDLASRNIQQVEYKSKESLNEYNILSREKLVLHKDVIKYLEVRLSPDGFKKPYNRRSNRLASANQVDTQESQVEKESENEI